MGRFNRAYADIMVNTHRGTNTRMERGGRRQRQPSTDAVADEHRTSAALTHTGRNAVRVDSCSQSNFLVLLSQCCWENAFDLCIIAREYSLCSITPSPPSLVLWEDRPSPLQEQVLKCTPVPLWEVPSDIGATEVVFVWKVQFGFLYFL